MIILGSDIDGIISDFDGTLADTVSMWTKIDQLLIEKLSGNQLDEKFVSNQREKFLKEHRSKTVYDEYSQFLSDKYNTNYSSGEVTKLRQEFFTEYIKKYAEYKDGAPDLLKYLKEKNMRMALATHGRHVSLDLYKYNPNFSRTITLEDAFGENIITGDDVQKNKPDPDIYLFSAKKLGIQPQKVCVFEDSLSGVISARDSGVGKIISVYDEASENDNAEIKKIADYSVKTPREILDLIKE